MNNQQSTEIILREVRISYASLFEPKHFKQGGKSKYQTAILIPKTDVNTINAIRALINAAYEDGVLRKWGGRRIPLKDPLSDGDVTKNPDENPEYVGMMYLQAKSDRKPKIIDQNLNDIMDKSAVYSGCICNVKVNFYAFDVDGNKGVATGLQVVQFVRDGEALTGGTPSLDGFTPIAPAQQQAPQTFNPAQQQAPQYATQY